MNHSRPNITDTLKKCYPFWEKLTDTQKEQLKTSSYIRDYEPGSFVHSRSEECLGILIVLSGQLRTYIQSEEGREVTLFRLGPGEVCTLSAACMMQEITFDIFIESTAASTLLITGASGGIGSAIARRFAAEGFRLALCGRNTEKLEAVRAGLPQGTEALLLPGDINDAGYQDACLAAVQARFGGLDVLVNCAGMAQSDAFEDITPARFDEIMTLNCRTPFFLCQKALPLLRQSQAASILNIASVTAHKGYVRQAAYAASKHAMAGFTKTLAAEVYEQGIRVHLISPGGVFTDMAKVSRPDLTGEEMITAEDIAEIAAFLVLRRTNAVIDEIEVHRANKAPFA